ncbi:MAG: helix-turn-helix domain-containing protein [Propioniciclava sp.]
MIGGRIRSLRTELGMTAQQLAHKAELSPAQISQIERGSSDPSLESLRRIARALGKPLFDLFADTATSGVRVVREPDRVILRSPRSGISYARVSPGSGRLEVLIGDLSPGSTSSEQPWAHPPSEECILVIAGELIVEVEGTEHQLSSGDSAYYESARPHRYLNRGNTITRFLISVSPPSY